MDIAVVQHNSGIHTTQVPGAVTITSAPTPGNLLVGFLGVNEAIASYTVGTGWQEYDAFEDDEYLGNPLTTIVLTRYAQQGDTSTLPAFMSAGATYWSHALYECSGVSGDITKDVFFAFNEPFTSGDNPLPTLICPVNGSLALTHTSTYNGNANASISGSWTLDEVGNNNTNYGSNAAASRAMNSGNAIDGTWTQVNGNPRGAYVMMLCPSGPNFPRMVRRYGLFKANGTPGSLTVPHRPATGNLLIAFLLWADGSVASPTIGAGWTEFASASGGTGKMILGLYHYVTSGDTTTLPTFVTAGSTFCTLNMIELGNVSGTWATDFVSAKSGWQASGATFTTTADTTTGPNQLALGAFGNYNAFGRNTQSGFEGLITDILDHGNYGSWNLSSKNYATGGSSVQQTWTPGNNLNPQAYIQAIFQGQSPPTLWVPPAPNFRAPRDRIRMISR